MSGLLLMLYIRYLMKLRRLVWDDMVVAFQLVVGLLTSVYTLCTLHLLRLFSTCINMF